MSFKSATYALICIFCALMFLARIFRIRDFDCVSAIFFLGALSWFFKSIE